MNIFVKLDVTPQDYRDLNCWHSFQIKFGTFNLELKSTRIEEKLENKKNLV